MKYWRKYNKSLVSKLPPHIKIDISNIDMLISKTNSHLALWTTEFDKKKKSQFWHVICDSFIDLNNLSRNTRSKIRRSFKKCIVKKVDKSMLIKKGFECYDAAFNNYESYLNRMSEALFKKDLILLEGEWHFWAVFYDDKIIAYSKNRIINDYCEYSTIKFHPLYLNLYSSYLLFFTMNKYYLKKMKFKYVNNGTRNLVHKTNIQQFLISKFGFRKAYCNLFVRYSKILRLILLLIYPIRFVFYPFNTRFALRIKALFVLEKIRRSF